MNGHGEYTQPDGRRYVGEFVADQKEGQGVMEWPDGRVYEGSWKKGKYHGRGVLRAPDQRVEDGEWHKGTLIWRYDENGEKVSTDVFSLHT